MSAVQLSRLEVADIIERFLLCTGGKWDWDDFVSIRLQDPALDEVRKKCVSVREEFPPSDLHQYCSEAGMKALRDLLATLR